MLARIILVVDEARRQEELVDALAGPGVVVEALGGKRRLWERAAREACDLFVVSRSLLPGDGVGTVRLLRDQPEGPEVVVLAERGDAAEAAALQAAGCAAVVDARLGADAQGEVIESVLGRRQAQLNRRLGVARDLARPRLADFVSASPAMQAFMRVASRVVDSDATLLLQGETGVGKERLARAIHAEGPRGQGPFVTVNCGALPESLLESELFGHVEGAFTGATRSRRGLFELAHGGTIFLDEIGDMPYHLQVKLLHVLQHRTIQPIGGERAAQVDVRVMAATNRDLQDEVEARRFRQDLYYRLSVVTLTIPPLRERREDIPELVESYLDYFSSRVGRDVSGITPPALEALARYRWPGNVRELINVIERAMLLCDEDRIGVEDLPAAIGRPGAAPSPVRLRANEVLVDPSQWVDKPWAEVRRTVLDAVEWAYLSALLRETGGRVGETAERAGMAPRSLYAKMKHHGLRKEDFKPSRRR
ncbi:MAG: sigma-54 interaction domain-containing protein [bacterium]